MKLPKIPTYFSTQAQVAMLGYVILAVSIMLPVNIEKEEYNLTERVVSLLMMVLPPESHHLLPESYQKIYLDINSGIAEYYPINYELDTLNKKFYWECIPILPDINLKKLTTTLPKLELTISENNRNKVGNELVIIGKHKK